MSWNTIETRDVHINGRLELLLQYVIVTNLSLD